MLEWAEKDEVDAVIGNLFNFRLRAEKYTFTDRAERLCDPEQISAVLHKLEENGDGQNFIVRKSLLEEVQNNNKLNCYNGVKRVSLRPIDMLIVYR